VLVTAVKRANENLAQAKLTPLPERLTPYSMRRTFASVLYALGEDPGVVMDEMGHTNPGLALRVYRQTMCRDEDEKGALRKLVEGKRQKPRKAGRVSAAMGSGKANEWTESSSTSKGDDQETAE
jgi:integrase